MSIKYLIVAAIVSPNDCPFSLVVDTKTTADAKNKETAEF